MNNKLENLVNNIDKHGRQLLTDKRVDFAELTIECHRNSLLEVCSMLRDEPSLSFDTLIDLCGVDYAHYGQVEWDTESVSSTGFSRGVESEQKIHWNNPRFAVVYHLLSTSLNHRIRLRVFCDDAEPMIDSVITIWNGANWFEREAYDLFGILFKGHPDLRRILTDYGFVGHPFRKDFPVSGQVEMRYDAKLARVIYEPVDIQPRVTVPRVIRDKGA